MTYDTVTQQAPPVPPTRSGARTTARVTAVVLSLLLIAYGVLSVVSLIARDTAHRSATFGGVTALTVDLGFESLEVRGSSTASSVRLTRSYSWSFDRPGVGAHQAGGRLSVTSSCGFSVGRGCSGHVRLVVPEGLPVTVRTSDGGVLLRHLTGAVAASSSDGGIDLRFAAAPARVRVQSHDGSIGVHVPHDGTSYRVTTDVSDGHEDVSVPTDPGVVRHIDVTASDGSITVDSLG